MTSRKLYPSFTLLCISWTLVTFKMSYGLTAKTEISWSEWYRHITRGNHLPVSVAVLTLAVLSPVRRCDCYLVVVRIGIFVPIQYRVLCSKGIVIWSDAECWRLSDLPVENGGSELWFHHRRAVPCDVLAPFLLFANYMFEYCTYL